VLIIRGINQAERAKEGGEQIAGTEQQEHIQGKDGNDLEKAKPAFHTANKRFFVRLTAHDEFTNDADTHDKQKQKGA